MAVAAAFGPVLSERAAQAQQARWRRFRALLLDIVMFSILLTVVNSVYGVTQVTSGFPPNGQPGLFYYTTVTAVAWPWLLLVWMAYYIVPESLYGASLGKMLLGLCVVRVDGRPLGFGAIVTRNVLRVIDALPGIYLIGGLSVLFTANSQRVGDRWAGTTVVARTQAVEPHATRRPAPRTGRALGAALLIALLFTVAFDYFGRPPLVIEGQFNQHRLFGPNVTAYSLGSPQWTPGRVSYPVTMQRDGRACAGTLWLDWHWTGWELNNAQLLCPP